MAYYVVTPKHRAGAFIRDEVNGKKNVQLFIDMHTGEGKNFELVEVRKGRL